MGSMPWLIVRNSANFSTALYFLRYIIASGETYLINFLVDLWIILFYLGNTEYYLVAIDLNYIQADFFDISSYCYLYRNSFIL
jgi:hypothetical protein